MYPTWFVRSGQLHGLFGGGYRIGLAAGAGQHVREQETGASKIFSTNLQGPLLPTHRLTAVRLLR